MKKESEKISLDQIKEAINNSGYLIEQRVETILTKNGYFVQLNSNYIDDETEKIREIDIKAIDSIIRDHNLSGFIFSYLIIECENNKQPIVFFRNKNSTLGNVDNVIKLSGIPASINIKDKEPLNETTIQDFLGFQDFHHYGKGIFSTQYCTFHIAKERWIAAHPDEQHKSFDSIIKCVKYLIAEHNASLDISTDRGPSMYVRLYYPLIVLQGELYEAFMKDGELHLKEEDHIQFSKQFKTDEGLERFKIDVIKEKYLPTYLKMLAKEYEEIDLRVTNKKKAIDEHLNFLTEKKKQRNIVV